MTTNKCISATDKQLLHRQLYRAALDWRKCLSKRTRNFLTAYCISEFIVDKDYLPLSWHRFAVRIYLEHIHFKVLTQPIPFPSPTGETNQGDTEETHLGLLHVRHPALLSGEHRRDSRVLATWDNLSDLEEEYLTSQVGIDVLVGDELVFTTIAGISYRYQVR